MSSRSYIYIYKQDLALDNPQELICHKTTKPNLKLSHLKDIDIHY